MLNRRTSWVLMCLVTAPFAVPQDMVGPETDVERPVELPPALEDPEDIAGEEGGAPSHPLPADTIGEHDVEPAGPESAANPNTALPGPQPGDVYGHRWQSLMDNGDYSGAAYSAQDWLREVQRRFGDDSADTFVPLSHLGEAWATAEDHPRAEQAYSRAVAIAETQFGPFHYLLVDPLTGLGQSLMAQGRLEGAASALLRAKSITHRNLGIYNLEQELLSQDLTEIYVGLGEIQQAGREQRFIFGSNEKVYGQTPDLVPALQRWAQWNVRIQRFADARRTYKRALNILESNYGKDDLRLIETLNMIATSFYLNNATTFPREGAKALERAIQIYQAQGYVDHADLLRAQTRLGDWYMLAGARSRSVKAYTAAVQTALDAGVDEDMLNGLYGQPRPLKSNSLPLGVLGSRLKHLTGGKRHILIEFMVDTRGRAREIRLIEDTVNLVSVARAVRERVGLTSFRPRFVDGVAVPTRGVRMFFEFEVSPGADEPSGTEQVVDDGSGVEIEAAAFGDDETVE